MASWIPLQQAAAAACVSSRQLRPRVDEALERARQNSGGMGAPRISELRDHVSELERELDGLRTAMRSRAVIEQAKGMIMLRERCDAETAFSRLVQVSQHSHRKLHDIAVLIVGWSARTAERRSA